MEKTDNIWMNISDLMSVLMMIFMFIAIAYMIDVTKEKVRIENVAETYNQTRDNLYNALQAEFKDSLSSWNAEIDKADLSVRFREPRMMFNQGESDIPVRFCRILDYFFPKYIDILSSDEFKGSIEEIRIEGHTSSEWARNVSEDDAYMLNMKLSQDRTRSVLYYCLNIPKLSNRGWTKHRLTANGLSSSKRIVEHGQENAEKSRRVEFRVRTNAETTISKILSR